MIETFYGPVSFDTIYDAEFRPQDLGFKEMTTVTPRGENGPPRVQDIDAAYAWLEQHHGPSMIFQMDAGDYYVYPNRLWYCIGQKFFFVDPDVAFAFKIRWG